ncbi:uncharacterized protein LOC128231881 [Mya arenaria]|uniref:uncharacterized protein LOC128231881 n=1 Tax=Mya arenaria TaxID=6604 RepID=UPI0022E3D56C|nr:uncharacterized protein LOC128231881 [Mya arenaria]
MPLSSSRKRPHEPDVESEESSKSNVKVVVRIRPQNVKEVEGNYREVVQAVDENILIFDPKENSSNEYGGTSRKHRDIRKRANRDLKFAFDHVFGPSANNIDIFNETTQGVLNGLLDGYNCSVFAYGATGAGKTHTMLGSQDNPGVMYHTMMNLYNRIDQMKDTKTCDVAVSYLEVYNETIRDLLMPGSVLPVREDPGKGVIIPGLSLHKPKTAEELLYMLQFGNQHRTQHPTDANAESSRSHAVLQVFVRQKDRTANISTEVRVAKLCLVDLAGSERATVTKNKGSRFREGANINRSLLALGNVINALAENKSKGFVPYRDSKLTRLLKDSLGGNCQTVMIAAVSPSSMSYEDTYNTLRYADRAKHIKATLKKNVLNVDFHMAQYGKIVQELRKEIKELKGKLQAYEDGKMISSRQPAASVVQVANWARYQGELLRLYVGHQTRVSEQLQGEVTLRNLQWKMYRKARSLSRIKVLDDPGSAENAKTVDGFLNELRQKTSCMEISSESSRNKVKESCKHLTDTLQKMKSHAAGENNKKTPEVLQLQVQVHHLQSELESSNVQMEYSRQVVRCQERELAHNERLLHLSLKLLRQQHYIIKGHGMLTSDLAGSYSEVLARVGGQEVTWGDSEIGVTYTRGYTLADMLRLPTTALKFEDPNTDVSEVECPAVAGSKRVFQFTAPPQSAGPSLPYQVDECSPPKAKRMMLAPSRSQQPAGRVNHRGQREVIIPNTQGPRFKHRSQSESYGRRRRSFSQPESQMDKKSFNSSGNNGKCRDHRVTDNRSRSFNNSSKHKNFTKSDSQKPVSGESVRTTVDHVNANEDASPERDLSHSKFSHINDTITKCKKFSHIHHVNPNDIQETISEEESEKLDDTFTIDPNENCIPSSILPHVDDIDISSVSKSVIKENENSALCSYANKNSPVKSMTKTHSYTSNLCEAGGLNSTFSCDSDSRQVEPALNYSNCVEESQTGLPVSLGENESGTSTIVDQSANSVASLASVSTLIDGPQNLSQNLSGTEETSQCGERQGRDNVIELNSTILCGDARPETVSKSLKHKTVTKSKSTETGVKSYTVTKSSQVGSEKPVVSKAMRSIQFDDSEKSPHQGNSYAEIVRTPTPDRPPLRQVGNSNTPLSTSRTDSRSSCESPFGKRRSGDKLTPSQLFDKENCDSLSRYGIPSLVASSLLTSGKTNERHSGGAPSYMQATKSHINKKKLNSSKNTSLNSSDEISTGPPRTTSNLAKSTFITKHARPLSTHMRSKSTSNVSSRAAWQI